MDKKLHALRAAFPYTIPVLTGFLVLGMAYGLLMASAGYGFVWAALVSVFVFAGAMQFIAVGMLAYGFDVAALVVVTFLVNARHLFYGLSMLERYKSTGWLKPYLIFGLCDETYSILCSAEPPPHIDRRLFMFFVTMLNHVYWIVGTIIGALLGGAIPFNVAGVDFALTALFTVIFIGQWQTAKDRIPSCLGVACALVCRLIFGPEQFLIPAMIVILAAVTGLRATLERRQESK